MMTKWRYYCLIVLCGCLPLTALAERFWGTVRDAQSNVPLPQVEIKDLYGKVLAHTDEEGLFSVEVSAKKLEIIAFLQGYAQKKVVLAAARPQTVAFEHEPEDANGDGCARTSWQQCFHL